MLIKDIEEELTRKDISKYMKDLGWTKLGSGNYGVVYGKKDHNMVVKILVSKYKIIVYSNCINVRFKLGNASLIIKKNRNPISTSALV